MTQYSWNAGVYCSTSCWNIWKSRFCILRSCSAIRASRISTIALSSSTRWSAFGCCSRSFCVSAPYPGQTSTIFFHDTSVQVAIFSNIFSSTKKFCPSDFLALIWYFWRISKDIHKYMKNIFLILSKKNTFTSIEVYLYK